MPTTPRRPTRSGTPARWRVAATVGRRQRTEIGWTAEARSGVRDAFLVYTRQDASSGGLDPGIRGIAGRAGPLHHRVPRLVVSLVPRSLRRARAADRPPPERMVFYALTTARVGGRVLALYSVGRKGGEAFLRKRFHERHVDRAGSGNTARIDISSEASTTISSFSARPGGASSRTDHERARSLRRWISGTRRFRRGHRSWHGALHRVIRLPPVDRRCRRRSPLSRSR